MKLHRLRVLATGLVVMVSLLALPLSAFAQSTSASATVAASTPATVPVFSDVASTALWAMPAIEELAAQGVVNGVGNNQYDPTGNVTETEVLATLVRMLHLSMSTSSGVTVPSGTPGWAVADVQAAIADHLGPGYTSLAPNASATRLWTLDALIRALGDQSKAQADNTQSLSYTDTSSIPSAQRGYVYLGTSLGLINGFPDGSFQPQGPVTRAQIAVMLRRLEGKDAAVTKALPVIISGLKYDGPAFTTGGISVYGHGNGLDALTSTNWIANEGTDSANHIYLSLYPGTVPIPVLWDGVNARDPHVSPYIPQGTPVTVVGDPSSIVSSLILLGNFTSQTAPLAAEARYNAVVALAKQSSYVWEGPVPSLPPITGSYPAQATLDQQRAAQGCTAATPVQTWTFVRWSRGWSGLAIFRTPSSPQVAVRTPYLSWLTMAPFFGGPKLHAGEVAGTPWNVQVCPPKQDQFGSTNTPVWMAPASLGVSVLG